MKQGLVEYKDDDYHVKITVVQCSLAQGFRRNAAHAINAAKMKVRETEGKAPGFQERYVAFRTHPELVGATTEVQNLEDTKVQLPVEPTLEEFLELPEALILAWERVVYTLNPHWIPEMPKVPEKKEEGKEEAKGEVPEPGSN